MPDFYWASQAYRRDKYGLPPEICVNLVPEQGAAAGTNEPYSLIPTEGLVEFTTVATEESCEGLFQRDGVASSLLISVHSTRVYATDQFGTSTYIGAIDHPIGPVRFAAVRNSIVILSPSGNVFRTDGTAVNQITDVDLPTPISDIAAIDQRVIYSVENDDQFYWSEVLQSNSIVGLSFATAERSADPIVGLIQSHDSLLIGGTETGELWQGTGGPSEAAFEPIPGATMERGLAGKHAKVNADNTVFFLGDNAIVYRLGAGYVPQRVSTYAIEEKAAEEIGLGNANEIIFWTYTFGGHEYVGVRMPTQGTFVYDVSTDRWHERRTYGEDVYAPTYFERAFDKILVAKHNSGKIFYLDPDIMTDGGGIVERIATANVPVDQRMPCANMRIHVVEGLGTQTGQGSNPLVQLDWSDDGEGRVFKTERWLSIGRVGKYGNRVIARACGQMKPPGRIVRVRFTDPSRFVLRKLTINAVD